MPINTAKVLKSITAEQMRTRRTELKYGALLSAVAGQEILSENLRTRAMQMDTVISWLDPRS